MTLGCADNVNPHDRRITKVHLIWRRSTFTGEILGIGEFLLLEVKRTTGFAEKVSFILNAAARLEQPKTFGAGLLNERGSSVDQFCELLACFYRLLQISGAYAYPDGYIGFPKTDLIHLFPRNNHHRLSRGIDRGFWFLTKTCA